MRSPALRRGHNGYRRAGANTSAAPGPFALLEQKGLAEQFFVDAHEAVQRMAQLREIWVALRSLD